jgi:hypothetical protein
MQKFKMMAVFNSSSYNSNYMLQYALFISGMILKNASFGDLMKT